MNMENVFEWLLATSLRASVLAVVIFATQLLVRRWLPAGWRHALWLPMLAVLVLPVLPEVPFGISRLGQTAPVIVESADPTIATAVDFGNAAAVPRVPEDDSALFLLSFAWLAGAQVVLGAGLVGYHRNMRKIEADAGMPDAELRKLIQLALAQTKVRHAPMVLLSPSVESPAVTGLLRPRLLLPATFPAGFTQEEARLILLHEFSHLKRLDLPLNWLICVLQSMHWFNPVLWFAFARMRADREAACDARVLSIDSKDRRAEYGGALLKLQGLNPSRAMSLGFVGLFERGAEMKSRIREISAHRQGHFAWRATGGALITLLVLFGATKAQQPAGKEVAAASELSGRAYIEAKLDSIVIPKLDVKNAELETVVEFLRQQSVALDTEKVPAQKGINFVIRRPRAGQKNPFKPGEITLQTKNTTLRKLVEDVSKQAGMGFKTDDFALTFFPLGNWAELENPAPMPKPSTGKAAEFAAKLIIPRADFVDTNLGEAMDFLNLKARELTKEGPVYPIVLDPKADPTARIRELRIRNAPISVLLKYCMDQTKHTWTADDREIRIVRP